MNARQLGYLAAAFVVLFLVYDSVFTVDRRSTALLFQFGEVKNADLDSGLHFKLPLVQSVLRYDNRVATLDGPTQSFPTSDQKMLEISYYVKWRIDDTLTYYRATGGQRLIASDRLAAIVDRELREAIGTHTVQEIVADNQSLVASALRDAARDKAKELGVAVIDVRMKRIDLPDKLADAAYERMRAEQTRVASELRARAAEAADNVKAQADSQAEVIRANAYRESEKMRGEGDARAAEIYAKAYGQDPEFFRFYRSINAYRDAFQSGQDVLVLQPKSEFFRYFDQTGGKH